MRWSVCTLFCCFVVTSSLYSHQQISMPCFSRSMRRKLYAPLSQRANGFSVVPRFLAQLGIDIVELNRNVFSAHSAAILTGITPLYLLARRFDETVQSNFYDAASHKNINQLPNACHGIARKGVGVPIVALSSLAIFGPTPDLRLTGYVFALGLPFVHSGKDMIKHLRTKACLRPWHQDFDRYQRSSGGFPSGHIANVTYMTMLFGMRYGPAWGIPLGAFAAFVFVDFLNCNRHYLSQLVAGAGLGAIYACAANKLIDQRLNDRWSCALNIDSGLPNVNVSYRF
jgi:membrane-associated phospholipid phosphatase